MDRVYSDKQRQLLKLWQADKLRRINLLEGSVRSGKTWISLVLWAFWVANMPEDGGYLMVAKTLTSLRRNILDLLQSLVGASNFTYSLSKKEGCLFGRQIFLEGAGDIRAENKIRGMTLTGAYCDEVTLFTEDFFTMLLSRLSMPDAKLIGTTNPDNPHHWLKRKFIDRSSELDILVLKFLIGDNIFLDPTYIKNLKKEYSGVYYDRFILGLWKAAEGAIYSLFANEPSRFILDKIDDKDIAFTTVGVDFGGNRSAHSFVCNGFLKGMRGVVTLDEFYMKKKISPSELEEYFVDFILRCKGKYKLYDVYCDSAETTLIKGLENAAIQAKLGVDVRLAKKGRITDRIRFFNSLMSHGRYHVLGHCTHLIDALQTAVWDDKGIEDKRLDDGNLNVDSLDALEYSTEAYMTDLIWG